MDKQTFSKFGLEKAIRKSDFLWVPKENQEEYRDQLLLQSLDSVKTRFSEPSNPLSSFTLKGNLVFKVDKHPDRIVERKISINLRKAFGVSGTNRSNVIENLNSILKEGIPFRVIRLDIKKFFESIDKEELKKKLFENLKLSPQSKSLTECLLENHSRLGGRGTPRGLPISSILSEIMMADFDLKIRNQSGVFFYSRYVDDIIIVTSGDEDSKDFLKNVNSLLPKGLTLNPKKSVVLQKVSKMTVAKKNTDPKLIVTKFEYLGYKFTVSNPGKDSQNKEQRNVEVDIADKKTSKYKLKISRSFFEFSKTKDFELLKDRIRYLASNLRVYNPNVGKTKLAGIYYNYPSVNSGAKNLHGLDHFLRGLVLHGKGRLGQLVLPLLTVKMKRELLSNSFTRGHSERIFSYFSPTRIKKIKSCWIH